MHHRHYLTLGREQLQDIEVLCPPCHKFADEEREQEVWQRRVIAWARKKYGTYWSSLMDFDDVEVEFGEWLQAKKLH